MRKRITINDICYLGFAKAVTIQDYNNRYREKIEKLNLTIGKKYHAFGSGLYLPCSMLLLNDKGEYIDCPLCFFQADEEPKEFEDFYADLLTKGRIINKNPKQYPPIVEEWGFDKFYTKAQEKQYLKKLTEINGIITDVEQEK